MQVFKQSTRIKPKISLILLDWSVRESFHLLHYLSLQTIPRDDFEVVIIEYYSRKSKAIEKFEAEVDTWIALEMEQDLYYHKHLMYNAGIVASRGEICIICDSDAMAKPSFLESVLKAFEQEPNIVLHLDQFRNNRRDLYPFCYPSFEEVTGPGCINIKDGKTTGLAVTEDLIHNRNYGACFCAKREDLISIGGADEHIDFIGHICGPYDFTFRLMNLGKKEVWHQTEFLYHTWHPGQAGENNYLGPHDGRHVSSTSLEALINNRKLPHVMNKAIGRLKEDASLLIEDVTEDLIFPYYEEIAKLKFLLSAKCRDWAEKTYSSFNYKGHEIIYKDSKYYALPVYYYKIKINDSLESISSFQADSISQIKQRINNKSLIKMRLIFKLLVVYRFALICRRLLGKMKTTVLTFLTLSLNRSKKIGSKIFSKTKELKQECLYENTDLASLCKNIAYLSDGQSKQQFIFVTFSRNELRLLALLRWLGLIPKIDLLFLDDIDSLNDDSICWVTSKKTYVQNLDLFLGKPIKPLIL